MFTTRAPAAFGCVSARLLHAFSPAQPVLKQLRPTTVTLPQTRLFTRERMIKNYGVLPLVGIMTAVPVAVGVFCLYQVITRDVSFNRNKKPRVERMDLNKPRCYKIVNTNPDHYKPQKELADLLQELADAEEDYRNRSEEK